jgi:hypothetical protein
MGRTVKHPKSIPSPPRKCTIAKKSPDIPTLFLSAPEARCPSKLCRVCWVCHVAPRGTKHMAGCLSLPSRLTEDQRLLCPLLSIFKYKTCFARMFCLIKVRKTGDQSMVALNNSLERSGLSSWCQDDLCSSFSARHHLELLMSKLVWNVALY